MSSFNFHNYLTAIVDFNNCDTARELDLSVNNSNANNTSRSNSIYKRDYYLYRNFTNILSAINRYRVSLLQYTWLFYIAVKTDIFHKNGHNIERIFTGRILRTLRVLSICNKKRNDVQ